MGWPRPKRRVRLRLHPPGERGSARRAPSIGADERTVTWGAGAPYAPCGAAGLDVDEHLTAVTTRRTTQAQCCERTDPHTHNRVAVVTRPALAHRFIGCAADPGRVWGHRDRPWPARCSMSQLTRLRPRTRFPRSGPDAPDHIWTSNNGSATKIGTGKMEYRPNSSPKRPFSGPTPADRTQGRPWAIPLIDMT